MGPEKAGSFQQGSLGGDAVPRIARAVAVNVPHHVTQRGNNRQAVFFCEEDRQMYLSLMENYSGKFGVHMIGYCLMTQTKLPAVIQ